MVYEMIEGKDLLDAIKFAGGLKTTTFLRRVQIKRIISPEERSGYVGTRTVIDIDLRDILSQKKKFELFDGDMVQFYGLDDKTIDVVKIKGSAVVRPGSYQLDDGMTVYDLIIKADSLKGDAFLDRAEIIRTNNDRTESLIIVNLGKAINKNPNHNILLKSRDVLTVKENSEVLYKNNVSIVGHVQAPGDKPFYKGITVYDLVMMGGGFDDISHAKNTFYERADLIFHDTEGFQTKIVPFRLDSVLSKNGIAERELEMVTRLEYIHTKKYMGCLQILFPFEGM